MTISSSKQDISEDEMHYLSVRYIRIYLNGFFFAFGFGRAGIVALISAVR